MKQVTMESVKQRIADLERADNTFGLGLNTEFELACLRELVAVTEQRDALVVENHLSRNAVQTFCDVVGGNTYAICEEVGEDGVRAILAAMKATGNMPATSSAIAALRAEGVEMFAKKCSEKSKQAISSDTRDNWWICGEHADDFARQLRESKGANHEA